MKGLAAEFRTAAAHVDRLGGAALLDHRREAIELGHFGGAGEAGPVGAKGDSRRGARAGPAPGKLRKRAASGCWSMACAMALSNRRWPRAVPGASGPGANQQAGRGDDGRILRQGLGFFHSSKRSSIFLAPRLLCW